MKKIFLDSWRTEFSGFPHYSSLGNKILHLFFCINYANKHGLQIKIPQNSNLDRVFDTTGLVEDSPDKKTLFIEPNEYNTTNIKKIFEDSKNQFLEECFFLEDTRNQQEDITVKGHFPHYELMPSLDVLNKQIKYNQENYTKTIEILKRYKEETIFVHYRGTDFKNHENGLGDCRLKDDYYINSFEICKNNFSNPTFVCLSDEPEFFKKFNKDYNIEIINNSYEIDWLILHLCKNLISSNSSFCWTASLHNKIFLIQPSYGLNVSEKTVQIPYGFHIKNSILVD